MPNLETLKSRVERAERNLKSAQTTREMESQALVEMWRQIRERFESQESDIQVYRDKLEEVEQQHKELLKLVETLLGVIEKANGRSGDEAVPRITGLAEAMLEGRAVAKADSVDEPSPTAEEYEEEESTAKPRAKRDIRDIVSSVTEARRTTPSQAAQRADHSLDIGDPDEDLKNLEALRAELDELGQRLGGQR